MTEPWTWGQPVARPETEVRICLRGDLVAAKDAAEAELVNLRQQNPVPDSVGDPDAVRQLELATEVQRLEAECAAASVLFRFRGLPRKERTDLMAKHPPTEEQESWASERGFALDANSETFPPALVAASCVEPEGITLEAAQKAFDEWGEGQWTPLWRACRAATFGGADPGPKSAIASAVLRGSEQS